MKDFLNYVPHTFEIKIPKKKKLIFNLFNTNMRYDVLF